MQESEFFVILVPRIKKLFNTPKNNYEFQLSKESDDRRHHGT
jgi:hypothetical protein